MEPLISVIVPIYKVEQYLDECVKSIVNQTYSNLEIILVDDGSPDKCPKICDEYAKQDSRIKVIHKKNGGLSSARNVGLKVATGDYIGFVDSDDWIAPSMYETLLSFFTDPKIGVVGCSFYECFEGGKQIVSGYSSELLLGKNELISNFLRENIANAVWLKLYKRDCIEGLRFEEGFLAEDLPFTFYTFQRCNKIDSFFYYKPIPMYYYRQNSLSIMHSQSLLVKEHVLMHLQSIMHHLEKHDSIYNIVRSRYLSDLVYYLSTAITEKDPKYAKWQKELRQIPIMKCKYIGIRHKIMCIILEYIPFMWKDQLLRDFCTKSGDKLPIATL